MIRNCQFKLACNLSLLEALPVGDQVLCQNTPRHRVPDPQLAGKSRCWLHGGLSTGPRTAEEERIAVAQWSTDSGLRRL